MKTFCISLALAVALLTIPVISHAASPLIGVIQPASSERITVSTGDKVSVNLGTKHGLVNGDITPVVLDPASRSQENVIGTCVVTKTGYATSICEIITAKREIEKGNYVVFDPIRFNDGNYYSLVMNTLAALLEPYETHIRLNVCVFGIYNADNAVTGLSEEITKEFVTIFSQKNRLQLVNKDALRDLVIYPNLSADLLAFTRNEMKRSNVDVLILGSYAIVDGRVGLTIRKIDKKGADKDLSFSFPIQSKYADLDSRVILTPQEMTKSRTIPCNVVLRTTPKLLAREEKTQLINSEAAGDPVVLQALKELDFNIVSPVEIKAVVDEQSITPTKEGNVLMLSTGIHGVAVSFKRGYFFNETLLYTSEQEIGKQALLDLSKEKGLVIELGINAALLQDPVTLRVYHSTQKQRQVLKPIYGVESDKTVETFKD